MMDGVRLAGFGLATSLGFGCEANIEGMRRGRGRYARLELEEYQPPFDVPYLLVPGNTGSAQQRFDRLLDAVVSEALEGFALPLPERRNMPLFIGSSCYGVALAEERYQAGLCSVGPDAMPMPIEGFGDIGARVRRQFGLAGADFAFNTACTAGANALLSAARYIADGLAPCALVLGLETFNHTTAAGFHGMQLLSTELMRPFDKHRSGLVLGEGCAAILLVADNAAAGAGTFLRGGASRCDNYSISASNPDGSEIAAVMAAALADAGLAARDITAIKAHGTASPLNDEGEAAGMVQVFDPLPPVFALKPYIGHSLGSCGVIETAMVCLAIGQGFVPATPGFEQTDERLGVTPITRELAVRGGHFMLNFFGFGGNNNSIILRAG